MKSQFRMIHLNIPGYGFSTCKSCKVWGDEFSIQIGGSSCEHAMGIFHIHAYLPFLPQKPIWGQDHHPEISQFPEFSDYWFHHLTRTDKIQLTKLSSFQHVQMECHLNGTFDQKERIIPLGFHISPISSGFCRPSLGHQRTSGQAEVYTWDPWRGSPGKNAWKFPCLF